MATSKILLVKPVEDLGNEGEQVTVKAGYARNYLLPKKLALPVNRANKKMVEALLKARDARLAAELSAAEALAEKIKAVSVAIAVKTGEGGKLFGSVTAQNIIDRLAAEGIELKKKQLRLVAPVKELGKHTASVRLHSNVKFDLEFEVVSENPIEEQPEAEKSEKAAEKKQA